MRVRSLVASWMITALVMLCAGDLLAARGRACGPHPCCTKGACKMTPKSGARLDRCDGDVATDVPQAPPMILASVEGRWPLAVGRWPSMTRTATLTAGVSFDVDRPPRVTG